MVFKYQNISDFIMNPFNKGGNVNKDLTYNSMYKSTLQNKGIKIHAICVLGDSWYYHIKLRSESKNDYWYDIVIRFFTNDPLVRKSETLNSYYLQFYSNSPSFIYQYAYIYKQSGYLIDTLYHKLDPEYINTPPSKTNPKNNIYYDKSIYCACRYLNDTKFTNLIKKGRILLKKKDYKKFFRDIADFKAVKFDQDLINAEKKLQKELDKSDKSVIIKTEKRLGLKKDGTNSKKNANLGTATITGVKRIGKKTGSKIRSKKSTFK